jgi:hypothetical protein
MTVLPRGQKTVAAVRRDSQCALIRNYGFSLKTPMGTRLIVATESQGRLSQAKSVSLVNLLRLLLWFGCDRNLNVSTLFELYIIAMFVS